MNFNGCGQAVGAVRCIEVRITDPKVDGFPQHHAIECFFERTVSDRNDSVAHHNRFGNDRPVESLVGSVFVDVSHRDGVSTFDFENTIFRARDTQT